MRLDKFLKISLLFKTRSAAEKEIIQGNVLINDNPAKPASQVKIGDILTIKNFQRITRHQILEIREKNVSKKEAKELVSLIEEKKLEL